MAIPECEKGRNLQKILLCLTFLLLGVCAGLLAAWSFGRGSGWQKPDTAGTNSPVSETGSPAAGADTHTTEAAVGTNSGEIENMNLLVDYPFSYGLEGWQLVLNERNAENNSDPIHSRR